MIMCMYNPAGLKLKGTNGGSFSGREQSPYFLYSSTLKQPTKPPNCGGFLSSLGIILCALSISGPSLLTLRLKSRLLTQMK